jgi:flagellar motor component MotA
MYHLLHLVIRTVVAFFVCYYLALVVRGIITIETLLDSQLRKIELRKEQKASRTKRTKRDRASKEHEIKK